MGWCSGEKLFDDVWGVCREYVPDQLKQEVCEVIIDLFEGHDADTLFDDPSYPEVLAIAKKLYTEDNN